MTRNQTMYGAFTATVDAHGDEPALEVGGERLTYRELDSLADSIAAHIVAAGGVDAPVIGLYANRSLAAYAGYLAIQRLGAAVVPLHPAWPKQRNDTVIERAGITVVVSEQPERGLTASIVDASRDRIAELREHPAGTSFRRPPAPGDTAYILFTSGSTGTPKGVPIKHGNVSAYLDHVVPRYGIEPGSRVSQTFDLTFDLSVFDLFATWAGGATLVVPGRADLLAPAKFVARAGITHWFSVPSVVSLAAQLGRLQPGCMPGLRWSLFCGEALTVEQAQAWQAAAPAATVENLYGPTELTLSVAQQRLATDPGQWYRPANGTVQIGTIHPGHETLLIGEHGTESDPGELCVRGPQRFDGYLDPASNVGRFYEFDGTTATACGELDSVPADLWYRTGDLVTVEQGGFTHLGRIDHQVKVHGYRVELGEIEAALREQDGVWDAVVLLITTPDGREQLAAAYTGDPARAGELETPMRGRLPVHMVPRTFTWLENLPLNMNGKTDRAAIAKLLASAAE